MFLLLHIEGLKLRRFQKFPGFSDAEPLARTCMENNDWKLNPDPLCMISWTCGNQVLMIINLDE